MRDAVSKSNGAGTPACLQRAAALRISRKGFAARIEKSPAVPGFFNALSFLQGAKAGLTLRMLGATVCGNGNKRNASPTDAEGSCFRLACAAILSSFTKEGNAAR